MAEKTEFNSWWAELSHQGLVLSPIILNEILPTGPDSINDYDYDRLRDAFSKFEVEIADSANKKATIKRWLNAFFEGFLKLQSGRWQKGTNVNQHFKAITPAGKRIVPDRVLLHSILFKDARYIVMVDEDSQRLGIGKSRRKYAELVYLLKDTKIPLGIFTNGYQIRLVYAGLDSDSWSQWDVSRWFGDENLKDCLAGLKSLIGEAGITPKKRDYDEEPYPLLTAIRASREKQGELSQIMGENVRRAVELLLTSFDHAKMSNSTLIEIVRSDPESGNELTSEDLLDTLY